MEVLTKLAWVCLIVVHLAPAMVLFIPSLIEKLYKLSRSDDIGLLIIHRGAMFLGIIVAALFAIIEPSARRFASVVVGISVIGFLIVYGRAGMPKSELRKIAIADVVALIPLGVVTYEAWGR